MGRAIGRLGSAGEHRKFSSALANFSGQARHIVEQQHRGSLVYAGGDDVLAFVPLPEALECAGSLRRLFEFAMNGACESFPIAKRPTLSVGLGIGHVMESMGDLLELGRDAEGYAKRGGDAGRDRNALAIVVDKRSGGVRRWRAGWDEWEGKPIERIREDVALLSERLSVRKVYEIARILARLPRPADVSSSSCAGALEREVNRSLDRASSGDSKLTWPELGLRRPSGGTYGEFYLSVQAWIERLLIARSFANAEPTLSRRRDESAA